MDNGINRAGIHVPLGLIVAASLILSALIVSSGRGTAGAGFDTSEIGRSTVAALSGYTLTHHICPPNLEALGITLSPNTLPEVHYRTWDDATKCEITAGDVGLLGVEEYWHFPPGYWEFSRD